MSPLTVFLGKLIGIYCIILAVTAMAHRRSTVAAITSLLDNPPALLLVELIGLMAGLAVVLGHNVWSGGALPVIITLLGWLATIRSIVLLALPEDGKIKLFRALHYEERFYLYMGFTLILGLFLTFAAFSV